ncbi:MAG: hypothetical protein IJ682_07500 [Lachnospiraceae bacterium]|nr:hypothetical protein [Lachnospiraceae bacterium]
MGWTVGMMMTAIGIVGIIVSLIFQVILIRVFAKQKKKMLEEMSER